MLKHVTGSTLHLLTGNRIPPENIKSYPISLVVASFITFAGLPAIHCVVLLAIDITSKVLRILITLK